MFKLVKVNGFKYSYKVKIGDRRYVHYMMNIEKNDVW
jgi:hypothetical protein